MNPFKTKPTIESPKNRNIFSSKGRAGLAFGLFLFLSFQLQIHSTENNYLSEEIKSAVKHFKSGKYEKARELCEKIIRTQKSIPKKILVVSVLTAKELGSAEKYIQTYYKSLGSFDEELSKSVLFFLERGLVAERADSGLKWGYIFKKEAISYPEYPKGLYYYSCILKDSGKIKESAFVSNLALSHSTSHSLDEKIRLLRLHILPKKQIQKEAGDFLEKYPNSEFRSKAAEFLENNSGNSTDEYVMR